MKRFSNPILVTRPYLPPLEDFKRGCEGIWANQWLTNNGPMLQRFQSELSRYLGVPLSDVAKGNLDKLESRYQRNKLHGEGDER